MWLLNNAIVVYLAFEQERPHKRGRIVALETQYEGMLPVTDLVEMCLNLLAICAKRFEPLERCAISAKVIENIYIKHWFH